MTRKEFIKKTESVLSHSNCCCFLIENRKFTFTCLSINRSDHINPVYIGKLTLVECDRYKLDLILNVRDWNDLYQFIDSYYKLGILTVGGYV